MTHTVNRNIRWFGIVLVVVTGLIHLIEGPEYLEEVAVIGVLFFLNMAAAVVSAIGIYRGSRNWGWGLGVLVTGGAIVAYVLSRTVGFLGFYDDEWLEPLGIISLVVEVAFLVVAARAYSGRRAARS